MLTVTWSEVGKDAVNFGGVWVVRTPRDEGGSNRGLKLGEVRGTEARIGPGLHKSWEVPESDVPNPSPEPTMTSRTAPAYAPAGACLTCTSMFRLCLPCDGTIRLPTPA